MDAPPIASDEWKPRRRFADPGHAYQNAARVAWSSHQRRDSWIVRTLAMTRVIRLAFHPGNMLGIRV
jgi:hypothetical protein